MKYYTLIIVCIFVICSIFYGQIYPMSGLVEYVNYNEDVVGVLDYNGNIWEFYGADDWQLDDVCAMIMFKRFTSNIYDDVILNCKYCGVYN